MLGRLPRASWLLRFDPSVPDFGQRRSGRISGLATRGRQSSERRLCARKPDQPEQTRWRHHPVPVWDPVWEAADCGRKRPTRFSGVLGRMGAGRGLCGCPWACHSSALSTRQFLAVRRGVPSSRIRLQSQPIMEVTKSSTSVTTCLGVLPAFLCTRSSFLSSQGKAR